MEDWVEGSMVMARPHETDLTVADFGDLPEEEGYRLGLSAGRLVREPAPGPRHGQVAARLYRLLWRAGEETGLGLAFFDTGFVLCSSPATVRVPDVAFVSMDRVPPEGVTDRFWQLAPDLAVEVVSPSNTASEVQQKALDYLDAGCRLVWIVDPARRAIAAYRSRSDIGILLPGETLDATDVIAGLSVQVESVFDG